MSKNGLVGITNNDLSTVLLGNNLFRNGLLKFAGAGTVLGGTLLGKQAVATAIVVTPTATGNGTVTASVVGVDETPIPGAWILTCTFAIAEGGVFKLEDPNGNLIADNITLRVGAGLVTTFVYAGIEFVVTDGGTDFVAADLFSAAVVADGDYVPFVIGGVAGAGVPIAVVSHDDITAAGAGDEPFRPIIAGQVRKEKLIIDADGDGSNITEAMLDQLRDFTIVSQDVTELNIVDNQ